MARIKRAQIRVTRKKNLRARVKGFFLGHRRLRQAKEAMFRSEKHQYIGRKQRKRHMRSLWIARLNAAVRPHGLSYSRFIHALTVAGIDLNRKVLSDLAITNPAAFEQIVNQAKAAVKA